MQKLPWQFSIFNSSFYTHFILFLFFFGVNSYLEFIQMKITFSTNLWIINFCHSPNQQMATGIMDIKKCYANTEKNFFFLFIHQLNYNFRFSYFFSHQFHLGIFWLLRSLYQWLGAYAERVGGLGDKSLCVISSIC